MNCTIKNGLSDNPIKAFNIKYTYIKPHRKVVLNDKMAHTYEGVYNR